MLQLNISSMDNAIIVLALQWLLIVIYFPMNAGGDCHSEVIWADFAACYARSIERMQPDLIMTDSEENYNQKFLSLPLSL